MKAKIVHAASRTHYFRATRALVAAQISFDAALECLVFQHFGQSAECGGIRVIPEAQVVHDASVFHHAIGPCA
jgi:hypothetical protein